MSGAELIARIRVYSQGDVVPPFPEEAYRSPEFFELAAAAQRERETLQPEILHWSPLQRLLHRKPINVRKTARFI